jgi:hypothetical protein
VSFEEIWDDGSYKETGLPRYVPMLSVVCPSNPDLVYFALEQRLFSVDVPARRVMHNEAYALVAVPGPPRPPSSCYVVAWGPQPVVSPGMQSFSKFSLLLPVLTFSIQSPFV